MGTWKKAGFVFATMAALACAASVRAQGPSRKPQLTIEQLIEIKHPSDPVWSPEGKRIVFTWDRADIRNLFVANVDGKGQPVRLTSFPEGGVARAFWSEDGESVYFVHAGDLWKVPASGGTPQPAWCQSPMSSSQSKVSTFPTGG